MKTLEEFDFACNPKIAAQQIHELAQGAYIGRVEPVIFIGDSSTGQTHLLPARRWRPAGRSAGFDSLPPLR